MLMMSPLERSEQIGQDEAKASAVKNTRSSGDEGACFEQLVEKEAKEEEKEARRSCIWI